MKVIDMHCDTIYEINRLQKAGENVELRDNHLNISLNKMKKGDYLLQNFAMFTHLKKMVIHSSMFNILSILFI